MEPESQILIYQNETGNIKLDVRIVNECKLQIRTI